MNNPQISIIVPVYNAEKYLKRCIDSILKQRNTNFELLLINDGSTDSSGQICNEYALTDNRIRVFHKDNEGVSSARNVGLDNAKGEWLAFIDADDIIDEDYLLLEGYEQTDVIVKGYYICDETGNVISDRPIIKEKTINKRYELYRIYINNRTNALWNKIIKRNLTINQYFDTSVSVGEDFLYFLSIIENINVVKYSCYGKYYYYKHGKSATSNINKIYWKTILFENLNHVEQILNKNSLKYLRWGIVYREFVLSLFYLAETLSTEEKKQLKQLFNRMTFRKIHLITFRKIIRLYCCKIKIQFIN